LNTYKKIIADLDLETNIFKGRLVYKKKLVTIPNLLIFKQHNSLATIRIINIKTYDGVDKYCVYSLEKTLVALFTQKNIIERLLKKWKMTHIKVECELHLIDRKIYQLFGAIQSFVLTEEMLEKKDIKYSLTVELAKKESIRILEDI